MEFSCEINGDSARVAIEGHVDERGAEVLKSKLGQLDSNTVKEVVFDFKGLSRIGSAGIGQLLLFYKNLAAAGGQMRIENVSFTVYELFQGLKLDTLFAISKA